MVKNPPSSAGDARDMGSIPGLGRSPGGGNGNLNMFLLSRPVVESDSAVESRPTLQPYRCHARQASLSFTIFQSLLKLMSIESVMPSNHLVHVLADMRTF